MKVKKAFKYRIYPEPKQKDTINQTIGCSRFVFNYSLRVQKKKDAYWYLTEELVQSGMLPKNNWKGQFFNATASKNDLKELKKNHPFLKEADSIALQASVENLGEAYNRYYKKLGGRPKFKSKKNDSQSYTTKCTNGNISLGKRYIQLPKLGLVRIKNSRIFDGVIKRATISRSPSGKYFVSVLVELEVAPLKKIDKKVGVDVGLKDFAITSDGKKEVNPKHFRKSEKRLAKLQKDLERKQYGSNNYEKNRIKVAKLHEKIANQRNDFLQKYSTRLINENQVIVIEDLRVKNMLKNHKLAKAISEASWAEFRRMLEYKAKWYGRTIIVAPSNYASSQLCSNCGHKHTKVKDLGVRKWTCPDCGSEHDRDHNAALNLLKLA